MKIKDNNAMFLVNARRVLNYVLERNRMPSQNFPMYAMPKGDESANVYQYLGQQMCNVLGVNFLDEFKAVSTISRRK